MLGTLINAGAVIAGSVIGLLVHSKLPKKYTVIVFHAIGLFTLFLGVKMALDTTNLLIMIFSVVLGSVIGELMNIEGGVDRFSKYVKNKVKSKNEKFTEGFVTAFLLFCMGSLTVLGAMEEGFGNAPNLLLAKSVLDGFASIALAAGLGIGVLFSVIPLLIYQGGLTLFAAALKEILSVAVITEMSAVGGILLIGLGINILEIKKIKILNMLPALVVAVILSLIFI